MSALGQADMCVATRDVRFVPIAAIAHSLEQSVGSQQKLFWNYKAYGLCGLEIDHQLELSGLNDRQVGGLGAFENAAGINADLTISIGEARTVTHQAAILREVRKRVDASYPVAYGQGRNLVASVDEEPIGTDHDNIDVLLVDGYKCRVEFTRPAGG